MMCLGIVLSYACMLQDAGLCLPFYGRREPSTPPFRLVGAQNYYGRQESDGYSVDLTLSDLIVPSGSAECLPR